MVKAVMIKDMDLVYAIYQYGSFSKAADELFISQSSLSMSIQKIESEIGVPLFDRRQHPIKLTQAGSVLIRFYLNVKPLQTDMFARIQDLSELRSGSLSIGGTHYLISYVLPQTIISFSNQYPNLVLNLIESSSNRFNDMLLNCDIDLCLKCDLDSPKLQSIGHAFFDKLYLAVPVEQIKTLNLADNALSREQIAKGEYKPFEHYFQIEDFSKMTFLQLSPGNNLFKRSEDIFKHFNIYPNKVISLNQFVTAYNLAGHGLGCTLASSRLITQNTQENLAYYELPTPLTVRDFHFIMRKDAYISKGVQTFVALFAKLGSNEFRQK